MRVWRVQRALEHKNYGLVADGYRFEDSPDCELVSSGLNSKNPGALALGRQGNWFLWGFVARPDEMTASARHVFLNTIAYMKDFAGQAPLQQATSSPREWARNYYRFYEDADAQRAAVERNYDDALLAVYDRDPEAFDAFVRDNLGYLYRIEREVEEDRGAGPMKLRVDEVSLDEDCRALGIANADPELLEWCVAALERGEDTARARRLLERYTDAGHGADASAWRRWLDGCRARLYFSDACGYRFFARPAAPARALVADADAPDGPVHVRGEASVELLVLALEIDPGWHVYGPTSSEGLPIHIEIDASSGYAPAGPPRVRGAPSDASIEGRAEVELPLRRTGAADALVVRFQYQVCDEQVCLPPAQVVLRLP